MSRKTQSDARAAAPRPMRVVVGAIVAAAVVALAGCGSGGSGASPAVTAHPSFAAGTAMAKLVSAGKVRVGVKVDQPGFGLKDLNGDIQGIDVEMAKLVVSAMGLPASDIE